MRSMCSVVHGCLPHLLHLFPESAAPPELKRHAVLFLLLRGGAQVAMRIPHEGQGCRHYGA